MQIRKRTAAAVAALGTTALAAGALVVAVPAGAATPKTPIVIAHISNSAIRLSHHIHAGRVEIKVRTGKGDHALQVAKLHKGYSLAQASQDLNKAFGGDTAAVKRIDAHITFRGGAEARPHKQGVMVVNLKADRYLFLDQNSNAHRFVNVTGNKRASTPPAHHGSITAFTYGFDTAGTVPAKGWTRIVNQADQPHFVVFQHVKQSTTRAQVKKFFGSGAQGNPKFGLRANTSSGVITPGTSQLLHLHLPAGKYLIACFWPDSMTGMPHAFMGMWKLIELK